MNCPECGATIANPTDYHTRPDNLAACTGPKEEPQKTVKRKPRK